VCKGKYIVTSNSVEKFLKYIGNISVVKETMRDRI
jgi:hypothetical protein